MSAADSAVSAPAPRIALNDINAAIVGEYYFTAQEGVAGAYALAATKHLSDGLALTGVLPDLCEVPPVVVRAHPRLRDVTFCVLILRNAWVEVGKSVPVSPENFDAELGRKYAREDAIAKLWPLLGYWLRDKLHDTVPRTPIYPQVAAPVVLDPTPACGDVEANLQQTRKLAAAAEPLVDLENGDDRTLDTQAVLAKHAKVRDRCAERAGGNLGEYEQRSVDDDMLAKQVDG